MQVYNINLLLMADGQLSSKLKPCSSQRVDRYLRNFLTKPRTGGDSPSAFLHRRNASERGLLCRSCHSSDTPSFVPLMAASMPTGSHSCSIKANSLTLNTWCYNQLFMVQERNTCPSRLLLAYASLKCSPVEECAHLNASCQSMIPCLQI